MTIPVMSSAPPVRATAPSRSEGRDARDGDSAAPFATALDGVRADGSAASRVAPRDAGRNSGRDSGRDPAGPASDKADSSSPPDTPPPAGVQAGLWVLLLAAATAAAPNSAAAGPSPDPGGDTAPLAALPAFAAAPATGATPGLAATLLPAPAPGGDTAPDAPAPGSTTPAGPQWGTPAVPDLPLPTSLLAAPVASAPSAQPALPQGAPTGPADPAAAFASLAAAAGATVTDVTTTAPAGPPVLLPRATPVPDASADVPGSDVPAAVPLDAATSAPAPVTGGRSGSNGSSGQDGGSPDSARDGVPGLAGPAPTAAPTPFATTAVGGTAPAAPPAPAPPVSGQLASHLAVLRAANDGEHSMTLVLTPERLGPVEIQVTVTKGSLDLSLRGAHEQGRAALVDALPDLRRDLESVGLTCSRLEVDRTTGGAFTATSDSPFSSGTAGSGQSTPQTPQQQTPGQRGSQPDWSDGRFRSGLRTADSGDDHSVASSTRSTSLGVDVRV